MFSESYGGGYINGLDETVESDASDVSFSCYDKTTPNCKTPVRKSNDVLQPVRHRHENLNRVHPYYHEWQHGHYPPPQTQTFGNPWHDQTNSQI